MISTNRIFKANGNSTPLTYQKFLSVLEKIGSPEKPLEAPGKIPVQCQPTLALSKLDDYKIPTLEELRVDLTGLGKELYLGGESEALERLERYMDKTVIAIKKKKVL